MSQISISHLSFCYDGSYDDIFEDVSFQIDTDWKLGFTGRNGKGKSTFLKLLMGKYDYQGTISTPVEFSCFPFEIKDGKKDTIDVIDAINPTYEFWKLSRELTLLDVSCDVLYRPFNTLSNGEQTKILLAVLFLEDNQFLLIDEPTNHLDMEARAIVSDYLKSKKSFILISHDQAFLDNAIDHILSINRANIEIQKGNFSSWQQNKERQDQFERAKNEKLKKEIKQLTVSARRTAGWSDQVEKSKKGKGSQVAGLRPDRGAIGHKAAKMMKRSKAVESRRNDALEDKSKLLKNIDYADSLSIAPLPYIKECLIEAKDLSLYYDGNQVIEDLNFSVCRGDRVALCGKNGSGKSSLIKRILGEAIEIKGTLEIGTQLKISKISQDTAFLKGNLRDYAIAEGIDESLFKAILRKFDFSRIQFEKDMKDFSSGQKKKVLIAGSLCQRAHLYIWDEPLNFVDILSRIQIEELLLKYKPTMIFVEHDRIFRDKIATKCVMF